MDIDISRSTLECLLGSDGNLTWTRSKTVRTYTAAETRARGNWAVERAGLPLASCLFVDLKTLGPAFDPGVTLNCP